MSGRKGWQARRMEMDREIKLGKKVPVTDFKT